MVSIKLYIDLCDLGGTTEAVAKIYAAEVQRHIESEYPDASVSVGTDDYGFGYLSVIADSCDEQDEITDRVNYIEQDVWCNGEWQCRLNSI
ncbi:hypothetical protein GKT70_13830 [Salmonella enterica]|nr:hypothetical protein [Salmonella enterica]